MSRKKKEPTRYPKELDQARDLLVSMQGHFLKGAMLLNREQTIVLKSSIPRVSGIRKFSDVTDRLADCRRLFAQMGSSDESVRGMIEMVALLVRRVERFEAIRLSHEKEDGEAEGVEQNACDRVVT